MIDLKIIRWQLLLLVSVLFAMLLVPRNVEADVMYNTFAKDGFGAIIWGVQPSYTPEKVIGHDLFLPDLKDPSKLIPSPMRNPQDVFITTNDEIYIADTGNNRIVHFDQEGNFIRYITVNDNPLRSPQGVFVTDDGSIYIADTGNKRVVKLSSEGKLQKIYEKPESKYVPNTLKFDPVRLVVDKRGFLYIVTLGGYFGTIQLDPNGEFTKFYGANKAPFSVLDAVKRTLYTREMYENELIKAPPPINNLTVDTNGFIFTVTSGADVTGNQIKKLNFEGKNILAQYNSLGNEASAYGEFTNRDSRRKNTSVPSLIDVAVDHEDNFTVIDKEFKYVSQYDANGELLFFWGGLSANGITQLGLIKNPVSVEINSKQDLFILDDQENVLQRFRMSEFGEKVYKANSLTLQGKYLESEKYWQDVLSLNAFYTPALSGLAKAAYKKGDYARGAELFHKSGNEKGFSESFWQIRILWMHRNFSTVATIFIIMIAALTVLRRMLRIFNRNRRDELYERKTCAIIEQLKHALYVLRHPIDGFSELRFENKGSILSAIIIYLAVYVAIVISELYTSFSFNKIELKEVNIYMILLQFVILTGAWVVCNYLISSIYRGEGRFRDIFVGCAYALVPVILIGIPLALISNVLTLSEAPIYNYIHMAMYVWIGALFFWKVQSLHNYSVGETSINLLMTILSIAIMSVMALIMFGLTNELRLFVYNVYQEVTLR
ncbi:YIP1 family protein [Paenibacillus ferrarius]|uniref:YIP1 family protein n=1 Tax=Paenibacillus ferrarius TaxID=1469647 RepID=UPI003D2DB06B